jgi:site-specific recombinase XerD
MKKTKDSLLRHLREYFTMHLPKQRGSSPHTITACRQTWNLLLGYVEKEHGVPLGNVTFGFLSRSVVSGFLDRMESDRGWRPATYNQRLSCIRSFFKYAAAAEPFLAIYRDDLAGIPLKKRGTSHIVGFMEMDEMKALLNQPDASTKLGRRDRFFMILMYDTAARDSEMLGMNMGDLDPNGRTVYLLGKGEKPRRVPITQETAGHFLQYKGEFHPEQDGTQPMFYTIHRKSRTRMSDDNVARFVSANSAEARKSCPKMPLNVTPHMFRHSRAMHLYRAGMPLALLSEWLGHEDPETTLVYAYADTEMKRLAIEKAMGSDDPVKSTPVQCIWENNEDMIQRLCGLC